MAVYKDIHITFLLLVLHGFTLRVWDVVTVTIIKPDHSKTTQTVPLHTD